VWRHESRTQQPEGTSKSLQFQISDTKRHLFYLFAAAASECNYSRTPALHRPQSGGPNAKVMAQHLRNTLWPGGIQLRAVTEPQENEQLRVNVLHVWIYSTGAQLLTRNGICGWGHRATPRQTNLKYSR
jgi:hypothetical protein